MDRQATSKMDKQREKKKHYLAHKHKNFTTSKREANDKDDMFLADPSVSRAQLCPGCGKEAIVFLAVRVCMATNRDVSSLVGPVPV